MTTITFLCCIAVAPSRSQVLPPGLDRESLLRFHPRTPAESIARLRELSDSPQPDRPAPSRIPRGLPSLALPASATGLPAFGEWSELSPPSREDHSIVYDRRRDRYLVAGGNVWHPAQNVWAVAPDPPRSCTLVFDGDTTDTWFGSWSAVYDSLHDRLVAIEVPIGAPSRLWELSLAHPSGWTRIADAGTAPEIADRPALAWDEQGQRLFVVGGYGDQRLWEIDVSTGHWSQLLPSGTPPDLSRARSAFAFDSRRRTLVVANARVSFDGGTPQWTEPSPALPSDLMWAGLLYDRDADQLIALPEDGLMLYTWREGDAAWKEHAGLSPALGARRHVGLALDPVRHWLLVSAGFSDADWVTSSELTALPLEPVTDWIDLGLYSGEARMWHQAVLDEARDRMIVYGGWLTVAPQAATLLRPLDGSPPVPVVPAAGPQPGNRFGFSLAFDSNRNRLLMHGGQATDDVGKRLGDLWSLDLASDPPRWEQLPELPGEPGVRYFGSAFFDAPRDRLVLFGGQDLNGYPVGVHALEFGATPRWRSLAVSGDGDGAGPHTCFYDGARARAWLDPSPTSVVRMDVGADSVHFVRLPVAGPDDAQVAFKGLDPVTETLVGFGVPPGGYVPYPRDLWLLQLGETPLLRREFTGGALPFERRYLDATVFDARRSRLLMYGGYDDSHHYLDDWFALTLDRPVPALADFVGAEIEPDGVHLAWRVSGAAAGATLERSVDGTAWLTLAELTPDGEGLVRWIDTTTRPGTRYRYRLRLGAAGTMAEAIVETPAVATHLRLAPEQSPTSGPLAFVVELPREGSAELELFDLGGRRVNAVTLRRTSAGPQRVTLPGGPATSPGLYWARLVAGAGTVTTRIVVAR